MSAKSDMISVVIPVHDEAAAIEETLRELVRVLEGCGVPHEVIVVDDGSTDGTWSAISEVAACNPCTRGLRLSRNFGKEAALCAGLDVATGAAVITMDGDLQHPPTLIPAMLDAWRNGAQVVDGVKTEREGASMVERLRSGMFYALLRWLSRVDLHGASDFKLLDRRVLDAYRRLPERNLFYRGMTAWLGFKTVEIPFAVPARTTGNTRWTFLALVRLATTAITSFTSAPLHLITTLGMLFLGFAVVLGAQTLYRKLTGTALDGFTTIILLLLITGSAIMIGLGIIGSYIARIFEEVKGRPRYLIAESTGAGDRQ